MAPRESMAPATSDSPAASDVDECREAVQVSEEELLKAISFFASEGMRPFGRLLLKRIAEQRTSSGQSCAKGLGPARLRAFCEASDQIRIELEAGGEWAAFDVKGGCNEFIDIYSEKDVYPEALWTAMQDYLEARRSSESFPGGRYMCAKSLAERGLAFLSGYSLGQVCHIVQLSLTKRKLLGYLNGAIVPYARSQTKLKDICAKDQKLCKAAKLPLATWDNVRQCLGNLLASSHGDGDGLPLSNVKRLFRSEFKLQLSETSLGHATVSDLLRDPRLRDLCKVQLMDKGYFVVPSVTERTPSRAEDNSVNVSAARPICLSDALSAPAQLDSTSAFDQSWEAMCRVLTMQPLCYGTPGASLPWDASCLNSRYVQWPAGGPDELYAQTSTEVSSTAPSGHQTPPELVQVESDGEASPEDGKAAEAVEAVASVAVPGRSQAFVQMLTENAWEPSTLPFSNPTTPHEMYAPTPSPTRAAKSFSTMLKTPDEEEAVTTGEIENRSWTDNQARGDTGPSGPLWPATPSPWTMQSSSLEQFLSGTVVERRTHLGEIAPLFA
mmetsp:Transcript_73675/g.159429  ORF Transcript_73675/g.159429 Transcript_73675/m.159429 type:complete len:554 (+) Transcript_73675:53-1714(+)